MIHRLLSTRRMSGIRFCSAAIHQAIRPTFAVRFRNGCESSLNRTPRTTTGSERFCGPRAIHSTMGRRCDFASTTASPRTRRRRSRKNFSASNCSVPAVTTTRSRNGRTSTFTAWPRSSPGWSRPRGQRKKPDQVRDWREKHRRCPLHRSRLRTEGRAERRAGEAEVSAW